MKRSEINAALKELEAMCETHGFKLPPFCAYTPAQWDEYVLIPKLPLSFLIRPYNWQKPTVSYLPCCECT